MGDFSPMHHCSRSGQDVGTSFMVSPKLGIAFVGAGREKGMVMRL